MSEISAGWLKKPLGDVANVISGYAFKSSEFGEQGIPVIKIKNIRVGFVDLSDADCVDEKYLSIPDRFHVQGGDVLISLTGSHITQPNSVVGRVARHSEDLPPCLLNQRAGKIIVKDRSRCDPSFLFYALSEQETLRTIAMKAHGAASQANVSPFQVESIEIPLPSLPIQRRIAGILSAYDELIENSQRRIKILEAMARALYREWFVHFRFPGHEHHPRVASPLGEIPKGWEVKTVEEIVKRIPVGKKYDQKTVSPTGAVPVFDQGKSGIIGYHDDEPGVVASEAAPVIVFANHTCYQRLVHIPFSAIQNVLPFLPNPALSRNIYWLHWVTNGLVVFNDYKGHWPEFAAKTLIVPSAELCGLFGEFSAPLSRQILKLERQIHNLRRTRDLLLPRLLSGQVEVEEA